MKALKESHPVEVKLRKIEDLLHELNLKIIINYNTLAILDSESNRIFDIKDVASNDVSSVIPRFVDSERLIVT